MSERRSMKERESKEEGKRNRVKARKRERE